jgi:orotate phosphoribosyltransferase-like protein
MIQPNNDQSLSQHDRSERKGRFTGDRLLRERPRVYRKVVELLAEPGMSVNQITKLCRVSEHTVRAVRDREAVSIAERKQRLISIFGNVAELGAERMEELAPHATLRDAGMAAGIATDKVLALLGETDGGVPVNIAIQVNAEALHQKYAELIASLPQPPAAMELQSGEELPKSD